MEGSVNGEFVRLQRQELERVRGLHRPYASAHEAYAVILEEVCEFWDEVRKRRELRNGREMLKELVQIAVTAQRSAEDLGLLSARG